MALETDENEFCFLIIFLMLVDYYFIHEPIHQPIVRRNRTSTADIIQENNGGEYLSMICRLGFQLRTVELFVGIYFSKVTLLAAMRMKTHLNDAQYQHVIAVSVARFN